MRVPFWATRLVRRTGEGATSAKIARHSRWVTFQMAEIMVPRGLFRSILIAIAIAALRPRPPVRC